MYGLGSKLRGMSEEKPMGVEQSKTEGESWPEHVLKATGYSLSGIVAVWKHEMAFRMEAVAFVVLAPFALWLPVAAIFKAVVLVSMFLVLITAVLNSAVEWVVDYISKERHPYAKRAKDMGSAAVFFALSNAGVCWAFALWQWLGQ